MAEQLPWQGLLLDVDGTLTSQETGTISQATEQAVREIQKRGVVAALATGRSHTMADQQGLFILFPKDRWHVLSAGATVMNAAGEVAWQARLPEAAWSELEPLIMQAEMVVVAKTAKALYASPAAQTRYRQYTAKYEGVFQPLASVPAAEVVGLIWHNPTPAASEVLERHHLPAAIVPWAWANNIKVWEITPPGVTKATGAAEWAKLYDLSFNQLAAIGDSNNDLELLAAVGWGVAMGNAKPAIKAVAQQVIGQADEDGLAKYLRLVSSR